MQKRNNKVLLESIFDNAVADELFCEHKNLVESCNICKSTVSFIPKECYECGGSGELRLDCEECKGNGEVNFRKCDGCMGSGYAEWNWNKFREGHSGYSIEEQSRLFQEWKEKTIEKEIYCEECESDAKGGPGEPLPGKKDTRWGMIYDMCKPCNGYGFRDIKCTDCEGTGNNLKHPDFE